MSEPFTLLDEVKELRAELARLTAPTHAPISVAVCRLSHDVGTRCPGDHYRAACRCGWVAYEDTPSLAADLGRWHLGTEYHPTTDAARAEIRPAKLPIGERP